MIQILYKSISGSSKIIEYHEDSDNIDDLYQRFSSIEGIPIDSFKLYLNGKLLSDSIMSTYPCKSLVPITMHPLLLGGKGGFGSMLRAIGAQIEKTTNKEACRDLSGRRLRDINAEKRFKEWVSKKGNEEAEKEKKRKEKLEKMKQTPKIMFEDPEYFKNKEVIPQEIDEALEHGLKNATASQSSAKRVDPFAKSISTKKQKKDLWLGVDLSEDESDLDDDQNSADSGSRIDSDKEDASKSTKFLLNPGPSSSSENSQQSSDIEQIIPSMNDKQISVIHA
ncbi:replication stress response regulator SDE2 [Tetranychus urticae]|uniref:Ubiquitin-like domain-containing protein n=1 Tax=Tetranychus urticae TaxID=32264 RepID=T1KZ61_TETUR|nr:replication stress response regulator SDE2 [Tetranychus urticae]